MSEFSLKSFIVTGTITAGDTETLSNYFSAIRKLDTADFENVLTNITESSPEDNRIQIVEPGSADVDAGESPDTVIIFEATESNDIQLYAGFSQDLLADVEELLQEITDIVGSISVHRIGVEAEVHTPFSDFCNALTIDITHPEDLQIDGLSLTHAERNYTLQSVSEDEGTAAKTSINSYNVGEITINSETGRFVSKEKENLKEFIERASHD